MLELIPAVHMVLQFITCLFHSFGLEWGGGGDNQCFWDAKGWRAEEILIQLAVWQSLRNSVSRLKGRQYFKKERIKSNRYNLQTSLHLQLTKLVKINCSKTLLYI